MREDGDAMINITDSAVADMEAVYLDVMPPLLQDTFIDAGSTAGRTAKKRGTYRTAQASRTAQVTLSFDKTNPAALDWAATRSALMVTGITAEVRLAIQNAVRTILPAAFEQQFTVLQAARLLRSSVGLTEAQSKAVTNAFVRLAEASDQTVLLGKTPVRVPLGGLSNAEIEAATGKYATRLRNYRTKVIARTETMAASNAGQRELWNQARNQGLLKGTEKKEWIFTPDSRSCVICEVMAGVQITLGKLFELPDGQLLEGPPAHPQCRCSEGIV